MTPFARREIKFIGSSWKPGVFADSHDAAHRYSGKLVFSRKTKQAR